jgi:hypothetical protein
MVPIPERFESVATVELTSVPDVGSVTLVVAEAVNVTEKAPDVAKVEPFAKVSVALLAGAVSVSLLMDVAVATPSVGVVSVGDVAKTTLPVPVVAKFPRVPALLYKI